MKNNHYNLESTERDGFVRSRSLGTESSGRTSASNGMKERISFDDFKKLDLCVARILTADRIEGSDKLVKLGIDVGEGARTLVAGIGKAYDPALLLGREIIVVRNLEPRMFMGIRSDGMLLAADDNGPVLLAPDRDVPAGAQIR